VFWQAICGGSRYFRQPFMSKNAVLSANRLKLERYVIHIRIDVVSVIVTAGLPAGFYKAPDAALYTFTGAVFGEEYFLAAFRH
jgi:hypothetical protein